MERLVGWLLLGVVTVGCGRTHRDESIPEAPAQGGGGSAAGAGGQPGELGGAGSSTGGAPACISPTKLPPAGLRPLGQAELRNELALFGEPLSDMALPPRFSRIYELVDGTSGQEHDLDSTFLLQHAAFVRGLAQRVTSNPSRLGALLDCDVASDRAGCEAHLFDFVADRLFRGLASEARVAQLRQVFDDAQQATDSFESGAEAVLESALNASEFLYHVEQGLPERDGEVARLKLTDLELASRLSFSLWGRGPDAELLELARAGRLSQPSELAAAARRLLNDPRAEQGIARFYRELLGIDEGRRFDSDSGVPPEVLQLMDREFSSFVWRATVDEGKGDVASLFEPVSWVNGALSDYYGWGKVTGEAFERVELDAGRYAGLLTLPAWLTRASGPSATHPSVRGWWLSRGLFCGTIPPEPEGVRPVPRPPGLTERERLSQHNTNPACAGCHRSVDPLGLGLEHFDALGRYREDDNGLPIDTSNLTIPEFGWFDDVQGLAERAQAASVERPCLMPHWVSFTLGAAAREQSSGECTTELEVLTSEAKSVPELLIALTQSEAFRYRAVP